MRVRTACVREWPLRSLTSTSVERRGREREGEEEVVGRPNTRHAPQLFRYHGGKRGREGARERERERVCVCGGERKRERERDCFSRPFQDSFALFYEDGLSMTVRYRGHHCTQLRLGERGGRGGGGGGGERQRQRQEGVYFTGITCK